MATVLDDDTIPTDTGVGVEFGIPQTSKRIDFLLSGRNGDGTPHVIIVELKQWSTSTRTDKDGIVIARRGGAHEREGAHPSYQAWSYAALLEGFNDAVYEAERERLRAFIRQHLCKGDDADLLYKIENGRIKPSK